MNTLAFLEGNVNENYLSENTVSCRQASCGSVVLVAHFFFLFFLIRLISFSLSEYYHFNLLGVSFELTRFQSQISRPIWFSEVQTEKIYCKYMFFINEFLLYGWL